MKQTAGATWKPHRRSLKRLISSVHQRALQAAQWCRSFQWWCMMHLISMQSSTEQCSAWECNNGIIYLFKASLITFQRINRVVSLMKVYNRESVDCFYLFDNIKCWHEKKMETEIILIVVLLHNTLLYIDPYICLLGFTLQAEI